MKTDATTAPDVDAYIAGFPESTQALLNKIRAAIRKAAPAAEEGIGYKMPAYLFHGPLVYFAGYNHHIGFYPGAAGIAKFKKDAAAYKSVKGTIQFPLDKPLPVDLVARIVAFRVKENALKAKAKAGGKSSGKANGKVKVKAKVKAGGKAKTGAKPENTGKSARK